LTCFPCLTLDVPGRFGSTFVANPPIPPSTLRSPVPFLTERIPINQIELVSQQRHAKTHSQRLALSAITSFSSFSRRRNSSSSSRGIEGVSLPVPNTEGDALRDGVPEAEVNVGESKLDGGRLWLCISLAPAVDNPAPLLPFPASKIIFTFSSVAQSGSSTFLPVLHTPTSPNNASLYVSTKTSSPLILLNMIRNSAGDISVLTRALFLILFARIPNRRVERVSASLNDAGEQLMIRVVRELPPRDSCRMRVNFESLYGTWVD
jgi:hypothetical protein